MPKLKKALLSCFNGIYQSRAAAYLIPLLCLSGYYARLIGENSLPEVNGYYLIHYFYTYDHGFVARGLLGEVLSWFFDTISPGMTKWILFVCSSLLILAASLCIGRAVNASKQNGTFFTVVFILCVVCLSPFAFRAYLMDVKLDKILWMLTLFAVALSGNKIGIWFVPLLCFAATLVNPVFLVCSMILIAVILLQKFYDSGYAVKNGVICGVTYAGMIAIGIYGTLSEHRLGFETPAELVSYYFSRYTGEISAADMAEWCETWLFDYFEPIKRCFELAYEYYFVRWGCGINSIMCFIFFALPAFVLLGIFWKKAMRHTDNKFQKFIFFLCMISSVLVVPTTAISWEGSKYFGNIILVQLCLMVYYLVTDNQAVKQTAAEVKAVCKNNFAVTLLGVGYVGMLFFRR